MKKKSKNKNRMPEEADKTKKEMTKICDYNKIRKGGCDQIATDQFNGLDLCKDHYIVTISLYNDIVKNDRDSIIDPSGNEYTVNKDKLV